MPRDPERNHRPALRSQSVSSWTSLWRIAASSRARVPPAVLPLCTSAATSPVRALHARQRGPWARLRLAVPSRRGGGQPHTCAGAAGAPCWTVYAAERRRFAWHSQTRLWACPWTPVTRMQRSNGGRPLRRWHGPGQRAGTRGAEFWQRLKGQDPRMRSAACLRSACASAASPGPSGEGVLAAGTGAASGAAACRQRSCNTSSPSHVFSSSGSHAPQRGEQAPCSCAQELSAAAGSGRRRTLQILATDPVSPFNGEWRMNKSQLLVGAQSASRLFDRAPPACASTARRRARASAAPCFSASSCGTMSAIFGLEAEKRWRPRWSLCRLDSDMLPSLDMVTNCDVSLTLPWPSIGCAHPRMRQGHARCGMCESRAVPARALLMG